MKYLSIIFAIALVAVIAYSFEVYGWYIVLFEWGCIILYSAFLACMGVDIE